MYCYGSLDSGKAHEGYVAGASMLVSSIVFVALLVRIRWLAQHRSAAVERMLDRTLAACA